jgi:hypothetical protein
MQSKVLHPLAEYADEWGMVLFEPIAVMGAIIGASAATVLGPAALVAGVAAVLCLLLGFTLDVPPEQSDARSLAALLLMGIGWLLMWTFFAALFVAGAIAWRCPTVGYLLLAGCVILFLNVARNAR